MGEDFIGAKQLQNRTYVCGEIAKMLQESESLDKPVLMSISYLMYANRFLSVLLSPLWLSLSFEEYVFVSLQPTRDAVPHTSNY